MNYASYGYWIKNGRSENMSSRIHIRVPSARRMWLYLLTLLNLLVFVCIVESSGVSPAKSVHQASVSEP